MSLRFWYLHSLSVIPHLQCFFREQLETPSSHCPLVLASFPKMVYLSVLCSYLKPPHTGTFQVQCFHFALWMKVWKFAPESLQARKSCPSSRQRYNSVHNDSENAPSLLILQSWPCRPGVYSNMGTSVSKAVKRGLMAPWPLCKLHLRQWHLNFISLTDCLKLHVFSGVSDSDTRKRHFFLLTYTWCPAFMLARWMWIT